MKQTIEEITNISLNIEEINVDIPSKSEHGNFTSNIAMKISSKAKMNPEELGLRIKDKLITGYDFIKDIQIVEPGFINIFIREEDFIKENLKSIESGEFKRIKLDRKNVSIVMILDKLSNIFNLEDLRVFMNMYYLGNIYSFAGCEVKRIVLVKEHEADLNTRYFLSNFKEIEVTDDPKGLQEGIVFCSSSNQGLFKDIGHQRLVIEGAALYKNGFEIYDITPSHLFEQIGFDRVKYTLANKSITKEAAIELTKNDLRYIQYPYSRISSVINILKNEGIDIDSIEDLRAEYLINPIYQQALKKILGFKEAIIDSLDRNRPYRFIRYANELCEIFYKINANTLFRKLKPEELMSVLKLLNCVKIVMKEILNILELPVYERM